MKWIVTYRLNDRIESRKFKDFTEAMDYCSTLIDRGLDPTIHEL